MIDTVKDTRQGCPSDYWDQVKANVDKAPTLTPRKREALRTLLHPARKNGGSVDA